MIYFAYFHSIMEFGIILGGISVESKRILLQQKKDTQSYDRNQLQDPM
jgi:hypothetical protein